MTYEEGDELQALQGESRSAPSVADMVDTMGGIDWSNHESVVRAAVYETTVCAVKSETGGWFISTGTNDGREYGYSHRDDPKFAWEQARRHPVVVAFEAKHRALPSAADLEAARPCELCGRPRNNGWRHNERSGNSEYGYSFGCSNEGKPKPADWEEARERVRNLYQDARFAEMDVATGIHRIIATKKGHVWRQVTLSDPFTKSQETEAWLDADSRLSTSGAGMETKAEEAVGYFYRRGAERLADAVDQLVKRKVISSRSEAADALLDFRQGDVNRLSKPEEAPDAGKLTSCNEFLRKYYPETAEVLIASSHNLNEFEYWLGLAARKGGR